MKTRICLIFFLFISLCYFSFNMHIFPITLYIEDIRLERFSNDFGINLAEPIIVLEAISLEEFTELTQLPYSYYSGALIVKRNNYYVVTLPFKILHKNNIFYDTLIHEFMHYHLEKYFHFSEEEQERIISKFVKGEFS